MSFCRQGTRERMLFRRQVRVNAYPLVLPDLFGAVEKRISFTPPAKLAGPRFFATLRMMELCAASVEMTSV
jgi:hypothetical protein